MSAAEMLAGAAPGRAPAWHSLEGKKVWRTVRRLQARIVKAVAKAAAFREGRLGRLEPYEAQASRTVLSGRGSSDASPLPDYSSPVLAVARGDLAAAVEFWHGVLVECPADPDALSSLRRLGAGLLSV